MIELDHTQLVPLFLEEVQNIQPTTFIEVGCRDGETSEVVKLLVPSCEVFAYEAGEETYNFFHERITNSGVTHKNLAISNEHGSASFYKKQGNPTNGANSLMLRVNGDAWSDVQQVEKETLDRLHNTADQSFCLWIDAEGHGYEVLQGAEEVLKKTQLIFIEVEEVQRWVDQKLDKNIISLLAEEFEVVAKDRQYPKQYNLVFKRK